MRRAESDFRAKPPWPIATRKWAAANLARGTENRPARVATKDNAPNTVNDPNLRTDRSARSVPNGRSDGSDGTTVAANTEKTGVIKFR